MHNWATTTEIKILHKLILQQPIRIYIYLSLMVFFDWTQILPFSACFLLRLQHVVNHYLLHCHTCSYTVAQCCQPTIQSMVTLELKIEFKKKKSLKNPTTQHRNRNAICWRLKVLPAGFIKVASSFLLKYCNFLL